MRRGCVPAPAAVGGASLHRRCRVPAAAVVRPCTGFLAPPARPAPAVENKKATSKACPEAVKNASYRVGGFARKTRFEVLVCAHTLPVRHSAIIRRRTRDAVD